MGTPCKNKFCLCSCVKKDCELYGKCKVTFQHEVAGKIFYPFIHQLYLKEFTKILNEENAIKIMVAIAYKEEEERAFIDVVCNGCSILASLPMITLCKYDIDLVFKNKSLTESARILVQKLKYNETLESFIKKKFSLFTILGLLDIVTLTENFKTVAIYGRKMDIYFKKVYI